MAEKRKKSLRQIFTRVAGGFVLGVTFLYGAFVGAFYAGRGDRLTDGEAQMISNIFGDEINTAKIRKHFKDEGDFTHFRKDKRGTVLPFISHIDIFGKDVASPDYSREGADLYGFFAHEATHCWQNQSWSWSVKAINVYEYTLKPDSKFSDFGGEQQASIIAAYARRFLHPDGRANASPDSAGYDAMLQKVVEDRFPRAKQTRLALDAKVASTSAPKKIAGGPR